MAIRPYAMPIPRNRARRFQAFRPKERASQIEALLRPRCVSDADRRRRCRKIGVDHLRIGVFRTPSATRRSRHRAPEPFWTLAHRGRKPRRPSLTRPHHGRKPRGPSLARPHHGRKPPGASLARPHRGRTPRRRFGALSDRRIIPSLNPPARIVGRPPCRAYYPNRHAGAVATLLALHRNHHESATQTLRDAAEIAPRPPAARVSCHRQ